MWIETRGESVLVHRPTGSGRVVSWTDIQAMPRALMLCIVHSRHGELGLDQDMFPGLIKVLVVVLTYGKDERRMLRARCMLWIEPM